MMEWYEDNGKIAIYKYLESIRLSSWIQDLNPNSEHGSRSEY